MEDFFHSVSLSLLLLLSDKIKSWRERGKQRRERCLIFRRLKKSNSSDLNGYERQKWKVARQDLELETRWRDGVGQIYLLSCLTKASPTWVQQHVGNSTAHGMISQEPLRSFQSGVMVE